MEKKMKKGIKNTKRKNKLRKEIKKRSEEK